ncbi:MAG: TonB-dependent receptor plug domain-containing protein, partial [Candidatus Cryptobacteroides sp.]
VSVKDYGGIGGLKTVSVRNLGAAHTLVSYDGFTVSDARNGQVDISRFCLDNVAQISVSIGPSDDIFKSARILSAGGVLSIETDCLLQDRPSVMKAGITGGCFNTWNPMLQYGHRFRGGTILSAYANYMHSDGEYPFTIRNGSTISREKRLNSDVNSVDSEMNLLVPTGDDAGEIRMKANFHHSRRGLPGAVILYCQNPTERLWDRNFTASFRYDNTFSDSWKLEVHAGYSNAWNKYSDSDPIYAEPMVNRYLQHECEVGAICGKGFGEHWRIAVSADLYGNILDSDIPECPYPARLTGMASLSAQYTGGRFKVTGILVGTYAHEWLRKEIDGTTASGPMKRLSPSLSSSCSFLDDRSLRVRVSVKDGFRMPTFNDLYYSRVGNPSLEPEKALQTDIGLTWSRLRCPGRKWGFSLSADIYHNHIRDKITAIPTMFIWKMRNIGKVMMFGADICAKATWTINDKVSLNGDANYSWQYAVDITDPQAKNWKHQIPYTPRHTGNLVLSAETYWITASYTLTCCSERYSLPQNIPSNRIDGYMDHGISLGRTFNISRIALNVSVQALNLTGANYEIIKGYPMPGRSFRIGLKLRY